MQYTQADMPNGLTAGRNANGPLHQRLERRAICRRSSLRRSVAPSLRRAFSLAELMIALLILGLGLLFIAAALPAGLEYTKQTVDLATARDAVDYAFQTLDMNIRVSDKLYDRSIATALGGYQPSPVGIRLENIYRPRFLYKSPPNPGPPTTGVESPPPIAFGRWELIRSFAAAGTATGATGFAYNEPFIKVRPFVMGNIPFDDDGSRQIVDDVEATIRAYLGAINATGGVSNLDPLPVADFALGDVKGLSMADSPAVPALGRVYPPSRPVRNFTVPAFYSTGAAGDDYPAYDLRRDTASANAWDQEYERAIKQRVGWTAFYRRVSYYGTPGTDTLYGTDQYGGTDDVVPDPLLYEIIVVVTRRTSDRHRYPRQDLSGSGIAPFLRPQAIDPASEPADNAQVGTDRITPMPWLVIFDTTATSTPYALPRLNSPVDFEYSGGGTMGDRILTGGFKDPATLTFVCTPQVGRLLPPGSIFIPAVNDEGTLMGHSRVELGQRVGFVPNTDQLPIYEVIERSDDSTQITVKSNGYYPWLDANAGIAGFPVWVIPPAFDERAGSDNQPVYERRSPILSVSRRVVRLHEVR